MLLTDTLDILTQSQGTLDYPPASPSDSEDSGDTSEGTSSGCDSDDSQDTSEGKASAGYDSDEGWFLSL